MPRAARLDAPGALQHLMVRGIEKRDIFRCDRDREDLISRLADLIPESGTICLAWAFLPNHDSVVRTPNREIPISPARPRVTRRGRGLAREIIRGFLPARQKTQYGAHERRQPWPWRPCPAPMRCTS